MSAIITSSEIPDDQVIVHGDATGFKQEIVVGRHKFVVDEPRIAGGTDEGPSPYDYLLAALGSCTSMTIGLYARRKGWALRKLTITLRHSRIYAADCADCETKAGKIDRIEREIAFDSSLTPEQKKRLLEVADMCPVHRTLRSEIDIQTKAV
jgi:putative redox protein